MNKIPGTERVRESGYRARYRGVLRNSAGAVIWRCEHLHPHRDNTTRRGTAARACAEEHLAQGGAEA